MPIKKTPRGNHSHASAKPSSRDVQGQSPQTPLNGGKLNKAGLFSPYVVGGRTSSELVAGAAKLEAKNDAKINNRHVQQHDLESSLQAPTPTIEESLEGNGQAGKYIEDVYNNIAGPITNNVKKMGVPLPGLSTSQTSLSTSNAKDYSPSVGLPPLLPLEIETPKSDTDSDVSETESKTDNVLVIADGEGTPELQDLPSANVSTPPAQAEAEDLDVTAAQDGEDLGLTKSEEQAASPSPTVTPPASPIAAETPDSTEETEINTTIATAPAKAESIIASKAYLSRKEAGGWFAKWTLNWLISSTKASEAGKTFSARVQNWIARICDTFSWGFTTKRAADILNVDAADVVRLLNRRAAS